MKALAGDLHDGLADGVEKCAIVGNRQDRSRIHPEIVLEPAERFQIKVVGRFVKHEQVRLHHEQSGKMGSHDPSAGHRSGWAIEIAFAEGQSGKDALGFCLKGVPIQFDKSRDCFIMLVRVLIRVFAQALLHFDEARGNRGGQFQDDFVASRCGFLRKKAHTHSPRKGDRPCIRGVFTKNERKERRFARPIGSDQAHPISRIDLQRRILEKHASGVRFGELRDCEHGKKGRNAACYASIRKPSATASGRGRGPLPPTSASTRSSRRIKSRTSRREYGPPAASQKWVRQPKGRA